MPERTENRPLPYIAPGRRVRALDNGATGTVIPVPAGYYEPRTARPAHIVFVQWDHLADSPRGWTPEDKAGLEVIR